MLNLSQVYSLPCAGQLVIDVRILLHFVKRTRRNSLHSLVLCVLETGTELNRKRGRGKYVIKTETLLHLRSLGFDWNDISSMLLVSRWAIKRRVHELVNQDFVSYSNISDQKLDKIIKNIKHSHGIAAGLSLSFVI